MPSIPAHLVQIAAGPPAEQLVRKRRVRPILRDVAGAAGREASRHLDLVNLLEAFHQLAHADAVAVAKIDREATTGKFQMVKRRKMARHQVLDVDVITYAGTV